MLQKPPRIVPSLSSVLNELGFKLGWICRDLSLRISLPPNPNNDLNWFFINTGRTPARVLETAARYRLVESLNRVSKEPEWKEKLPYYEKLLIPNERILSFQPLEPSHLTPEEITAIRKGERTLFAYGYVSYLDVFGDCHETRFCYVYFVPQGDQVSIVKATWTPHLAAPAAYSKAT